jgi:hypothetical protein
MKGEKIEKALKTFNSNHLLTSELKISREIQVKFINRTNFYKII